MVLASPSSGDHVHAKFEYKTIQIGQSGGLSVHFADAVSPEKSNWLMRAEKKSASSRP